MTGALGALQLTLLAALGFALLAAFGCAAVLPWVGQRLEGLPAHARSRVLLAWAAAPWAVAAALVALCFLPSILAAIDLGHDHCSVHDDAHAHFCLVHLPPTAGGLIGWILLAVALASRGLAVLLEVRSVIHARELLRLLAVTRTHTAGDVVVVDAPLPLSLTAGILRPTIYLSSRLVAALPHHVIKVVLEHERAHARRRDSLRKLVASIVSLGHLPWVRKRLLLQLSLACEQACDDEAAERVGDRLRVADAIVTVERSFAGHSHEVPAGASAFGGGSNIAARVQALLSDAPPGRTRGTLGVWLLAAGGAAAAGAEPIHHAAETLLGLLAG